MLEISPPTVPSKQYHYPKQMHLQFLLISEENGDLFRILLNLKVGRNILTYDLTFKSAHIYDNLSKKKKNTLLFISTVFLILILMTHPPRDYYYRESPKHLLYSS